MNKILLGLNGLTLALVGFLFFKINNTGEQQAKGDVKEEENKTETPKTTPLLEQKGTAPTGKIAYINIDRLNDESLEIKDMTEDFKKRRMSIESSLESLNMEYQKKVEEYQTSAKAGIASESEMAAKAKYIESIEKQAQSKQILMDNLTSDIAKRNEEFQRGVRNFLINWNSGRYDYVLAYSEAVPTMLLGNTSLEITNEVVAEINNNYKATKTKK